jgi:hypothetical protein
MCSGEVTTSILIYNLSIHCLLETVRLLLRLLFFHLVQRPPPLPSGPGSPHLRRFYITPNDAPQSVGFLWAGDKLVAETST